MDNVKTKLSNEQNNELKEKLTIEEVIVSLKLAARGKAAGTDGIPYEVYKIIVAWHENEKKRSKQNDPKCIKTPDITTILTSVFNDVEMHAWRYAGHTVQRELDGSSIQEK